MSECRIAGDLLVLSSLRSIRLGKQKRIPATTGIGFTSVADGFEDVAYEVMLDLVGVRRLAEKAARNKSGKSKMGPLQVRVMSRRPVA